MGNRERERIMTLVHLLMISAFSSSLAGGSRDPLIIGSDEEFESTVQQDGACWAVLFTSKTRVETVAPVLRSFSELEARLPSIRYGVADVDQVKAVASEFNVRKRMV